MVGEPERLMHREIVFPNRIFEKGSLTPSEKTLLGTILSLTNGKTIVEVGSFKGVTTKYLCNFVVTNRIGGRVFAFDVPSVCEALRADPELAQFHDDGVLEFVPGLLPDSLRTWLSTYRDEVDFVLDDAQHDYPSVYGELRLLWPRLSECGFILCHDYSKRFDGVQYAVNKFAKKYNANFLPLTSSDNATASGYESVLVGLAKKKKQDEPALRTRISHEFVPYKIKLANSGLWKAMRPLIRAKKVS